MGSPPKRQASREPAEAAGGGGGAPHTHTVHHDVLRGRNRDCHGPVLSLDRGLPVSVWQLLEASNQLRMPLLLLQMALASAKSEARASRQEVVLLADRVSTLEAVKEMRVSMPSCLHLPHLPHCLYDAVATRIGYSYIACCVAGVVFVSADCAG